MAILQPDDYMRQYEDEVVFLTGATGNLGACLLYKLAMQLPTKKIFVLCRGSVSDAMAKWEQLMPEHIDDILDTQKVHILIGDMRKPGFGLKPSELDVISDEVTTVIHTAANISLTQDLQESVRDNCVPVAVLLETASRFRHLKFLLHTSTASVALSLPSCQVEEQLYVLDGHASPAKEELASILSSDSPLPDSRFPWPYAQAKYLAERLVLGNESQIPTLVIRPTLIGPAIKDPYPLYGSDGAIPSHSIPQIFLSMDYQQREKLINQPWMNNNAGDEIPVDIVANCCLLHVASRTTGVVHASCELYFRFPLNESLNVLHKCLTENQIKEILKLRRGFHHPLAVQMYETATTDHRNYRFSCKRSETQKLVTGPLSLSLSNHDPADFFAKRIWKVAQKSLRSLGVTGGTCDSSALKAGVRRIIDTYT